MGSSLVTPLEPPGRRNALGISLKQKVCAEFLEAISFSLFPNPSPKGFRSERDAELMRGEPRKNLGDCDAALMRRATFHKR